MAKYCLKKPTKRTTCKKRYKIAKKVKDHNRKLRRDEKQKKSQQKHRRSNPKLISIPNKCPFKEELLAEAEARRVQLNEDKTTKKADKGKPKQVVVTQPPEESKKAKMREQRRLEQQEKLDGVDPSQYVIEAADLLGDEEGTDGADGRSNRVGVAVATKQSRPARAFAGEVRKIVESADVIIEVLDARDPLGSRSSHIESLVIGSGKRLLLLLNKIDLVPKEAVLGWLAHLRRELPTIAFKASTQEQRALGHYRPRGKGGVSGMKQLEAEKFSARCMGAELVMRALGNYCRNAGVKTTIRVGIVGFPNVGKSSVINSLKRKRICATGAIPGLTRTVQEIQLDAHIRLLDSPGVVLAAGGGTDPAELALKNALKVETLADPVAPIQALLRRCSVRVLMLHYSIPQFASTDEFLSLVARRMGRLKRGGVPNLTAAARHVLNDWNKGKLRYYTEPPTQAPAGSHAGAEQGRSESETQLVSSFAKEFNLDEMEDEIRTLVEEFPSSDMQLDTTATLYDPTIPMPTSDDPNGEAMETDGPQSTATKTVVMASKKAVAAAGPAKKRVRFVGENDGLPPPEMLNVEGGNAQLNKLLRGVMKKRRKSKKRAEKNSGELADSLAAMSSLDAEAMMGAEGEDEGED